MTTDELLTIREVADRLGVSPNLVRRWITTGKLERDTASLPYRVSLAAATLVREATRGRGLFHGHVKGRFRPENL